MSTVLSDTQQLVWQIFDEICQIPRPSGKEEKIMNYLREFALKHGFLTRTDKAGNIVMIRPGKQPAIAMQAHTDMVCEKRGDSTHNFETDALQTYIEEGWMKAKGTTLGADNGIGVAMALAAMVTYPGDRQLEGLFTVEEETGLSGASAVEAGFISAPVLLNLDSEDENELIVGCAGGCETVGYWKVEEMPAPEGMFPIEITIKGLLGGHSGSDIHLPRANANQLLGRFLQQTAQKYPFYLCSLAGGGLHNAIAREANALFLVPYADREHIRIDWNIYIAEQEDQWLAHEPKMRMDLSSRPKQEKVFVPELTNQLIQALCTCPHGVVKMSDTMQGVVETSTNLASIKRVDDNIVITTSQRSSFEDQLNALAFQTYTLLTDCGAMAGIHNGYPAWEPQFDTPLLKTAKEVYKQVWNKQPEVKIIHAGLECGLFSKVMPNLNILSFGPTLLGVHSPDERLNMASTNQTTVFLMQLLANLS